MLSDDIRKNRVLLIGITAVSLLSVTALASGLSTVEVQSSRQLAFDAVQQVAGLANLSMPSSAISALSFLAGFIRLVLFVLLPFSIYYFIKSPNVRKRVLLQLLYLVGFAYVVLALSKTLGQVPDQPALQELPVIPDAAPVSGIISGITETPSWVFIVASALITVLVTALVWRAYRRLARSENPASSAQTEARWALDALDRGHELESVIFRAYYRLCSTSSERLGHRRGRDMTPMEYESVLSSSGLPRSPLARLTRLFEKARYGSMKLSSEDEQEAIAALNLILEDEI